MTDIGRIPPFGARTATILSDPRTPPERRWAHALHVARVSSRPGRVPPF